MPKLVYDAERAMRLIQAERITVLPGAPTIYQTILDHPARAGYDLCSLRLAVTGAAVVPVALVERMQSRAGLRHGAHRVRHDRGGGCHAWAGRPMTRSRRHHVRPRDRGLRDRHRPHRTSRRGRVPGARAERDARLPRRPERATAEAIDADGWLHTGDVGTLDEAGYLTITDRLKDMYICGGFNVYPAEVEQALARLDGVAESAVIGVPDQRLGEVGMAYVVAAPVTP